MAKDFFKDFTGTKFLEIIARAETTCAQAATIELPKLGEKAALCHETLGMTLALLDCGGSCYWGCAQGDHRLEYLTGRAANSSYAALNLMHRGYYDQSLSLARTLGEIANLMALFAYDKSKLDEWKRISDKERRQKFSAVKVRLAIDSMSKPLPVDKERYGRLSVFSIHASPDTLAQAHGAQGKGVTLPVFQPVGFLLALNEISLPIAFITLFAGSLLKLHDDIRKVFKDIAILLIENMGGVSITVDGRPWFKLH